MRFVTAVFILAGMIIGVGMFAIPFSFVRAGFWIGLAELALLAASVLLLHLLYADIALATPRSHRMPGYVRLYLGAPAMILSWTSTLLGSGGALLAYIVVGALFLQTLMAPWFGAIPLTYLAGGLALFSAAVTFFPLKQEARINGAITFFEIAFITVFALMLLPRASVGNLTAGNMRDVVAPYGVLLFALSGAAVIPDMIAVLGRRPRQVRLAVVAGSLIPALLYALFAAGVVGVSGGETSPEAIAGLRRALGERIVLFGSAAGFLAVLTSLIALAENSAALLQLDLKFSDRASWLLVSVVPFAFYLLGAQDFITIIGAVGALAFGIDALLIVATYRRMKAQAGIPIAPVQRMMQGTLCTMVILGIVAYFYR